MTGVVGPRRYVRSERVLWRRTTDAVIVLPIDHGEFFDLTGTGVALWELLDVPRTLDEAAAELLTRFEGSVAAVTADVAPVLDDLVRRRAVVLVGRVDP